jgi:hypothetical protein
VVVATTLNRAQIQAMGSDAAHVIHVIDDFNDPALRSLFQ